MAFFTVGNLLTLGIVVLLLILYRQLDRNNRSLEKVKKYADKLKDEIRVYTEERGEVVKDFIYKLGVEQLAARELMDRLQKMTEEELSRKAEAINRIDERIKAYDVSMEELVKMTARVQENLNRIRDESAFVENAGRKIGEAKNQLDGVEKGLGALELRFEKENRESLEKAAAALTASVKSSLSDLEERALTVGRQVEEHRAAVDKVEKSRTAALARDTEIINKTLREAVEKAGVRADRMEDAALVKLREQAQERVRRLQTAMEEKLKAAGDGAKLRITEIQEMIKVHRESSKNELGEMEARRKQYREEWKKDVQELDALAGRQRDEWQAMTDGWRKTALEAERKVLEAVQAELEEYRAVQGEEFKRLGSLADDAGRLEGELRRSMDEAAGRVREEFSRFGEEAARGRDAVRQEFDDDAAALKAGMDGLEQELNALKSRAYENVSEKLKVFEDDFFADLGRRSDDIDRRLAEWQAGLDARLEEIAREGEAGRIGAENRLNEEYRKNLAAQGERLQSELEHLKSETAAFEEGVRGDMRAADENLRTLREQLDRDLAEARSAAEDSLRVEIGRYSLSMSEAVRKSQRELEEELRALTDQVDARNAEINGQIDAARRDIEDIKTTQSGRLRDLDADLEDSRRRLRDLAAEAEDRLGRMREALDTLREETGKETRLFERNNELKLELERGIEDLKGDLDRLEQRKSEAAQLENQFLRIKRLEDDVNARLLRFNSEQHHIEEMEKRFNRVVQISQAVEEKLARVSDSDDTLQAIQVQIRRLDDAIRETEEKYQRVERKNQILEEINDGIDRNFKALQESESAANRINGDLESFTGEFTVLRQSVEILSKEHEKASETAEKLEYLDESLSVIEKRIKEMDTAREWLARAETRLAELDKDIQSRVRVKKSLEEGDKRPGAGRDTVSLADRETVVSLRQKGWSLDEISAAMKLSLNEVDLILEIAQKE
jgi:chromosome segregation ATPase